MKTFQNTIIFLILFLCNSNLMKAQDVRLYNAISKLIVVNEKVFRSDEFYEKSIVFSISVGLNKSGVIDTVIYSDSEDKLINHLFDLKTITKGLKANKEIFKSHKNEFVVLFVSLVRGDENFIRIDNGNQYITNWKAIIKNSKYIDGTGRRQIMLNPIFIYSKGKGIKN